MEASVWVALGLLAVASSGTDIGGEGGNGEKGETGKKRFGIVSTGLAWKGVLEGAVAGLVGGGGGGGPGGWFKGVECCGVDAGGLHAGGEGGGGGDVEGRVKGAVGRLVDGPKGGGDGEVGVVVLGCAGMVGMEGWVRSVVGEGVRVVDGVKAGVGMLQGLVRGGF